MYIFNKRKTRETVDLLLNGVWELVTDGTEQVEVPDAICSSVLTGNAGLQKCRPLWPEEKTKKGKTDLLLVEEDQVREHKLDIRKSMGPDSLHPWVLRELADF